jgi:hypothetical protein
LHLIDFFISNGFEHIKYHVRKFCKITFFSCFYKISNAFLQTAVLQGGVGFTAIRAETELPNSHCTFCGVTLAILANSPLSADIFAVILFPKLYHI